MCSKVTYLCQSQMHFSFMYYYSVTISEWNEEIVLLYGQNERAFDSVTTVFPNAWEYSVASK